MEDGYYEEDDGWLYVEESHDVADELAEHAVASPPHNWEACDSDSQDDFDIFDYWWDMDNTADDYYEIGGTAGQKRKRAASAAATAVASVKVRARITLSPTPTVLWRSRASRDTQEGGRSVNLAEMQAVALLKDWRIRFADTDGFTPHSLSNAAVLEEVHYVSDSEQRDVHETDIGPEVHGGSLALILQQVVHDKLATAGVAVTEGTNATVLDCARRMARGEDDPNQLLEELTSFILNTQKDGNSDSGLSIWLTQQRRTAKHKGSVVAEEGSEKDEGHDYEDAEGEESGEDIEEDGNSTGEFSTGTNPKRKHDSIFEETDHTLSEYGTNTTAFTASKKRKKP